MGAETTIGRLLLETAKPVFHVARLIGYFPFGIKSNEIAFSKLSIPVISTLFLTLWHCYGVVVRFSYQKLYMALSQSKNETERFAEALAVVCVAGAALFLRISAIIKGPKLLKFWAGNVEQLQRFVALDEKLNFFAPTSIHHRNLQRIRSSIRRPLVVGLVYATIWITASTTSFLVGLFVRTHGLRLEAFNKNPSDVAVFMSANTILMATVNMHFSFTLVLSFFPKLYATCFKVIAMEIASVMDNSFEEARSAIPSFRPSVRLKIWYKNTQQHSA